MKAVQSLGLSCLLAVTGSAQVQEAWVNRYNGGYTNLDHRPVALALDSAGNVFVAGSSRSSATNYDYVVLKYAPDGTQSWAARYAPPGGGTNTVAALALGRDGSTVVTGTGGTVSVGPGGAVAWAAPCSGTSVAVDTNANVWVTGLPASEFPFGTVELDPAGSSVRTNTFDVRGLPAGSQLVGIDAASDIYVAGWAVVGFTSWPQGTTNFIDASYWVVKYDPIGSQLWELECLTDEHNPGTTVVKAMCFDTAGNVYLVGNGGGEEGDVGKISPGGQEVWHTNWGLEANVSAMAVDGAGNVYVTGSTYFTLKLASSGGAWAWASDLALVDSAYTAAADLAIDLATNVYVCGTYALSSDGATGWATVKLDSDAKLLWTAFYNRPASGNSGAVAIAAAPDSSIYVTGYSANTSGGTDITTIKYVQDPTIQPQPGGAMLLQLPGLPGSSAGLAATTNLMNWIELGPVVANTNGLFQFTDTNATLYPHRFYRWH
ncbi:MAG TPA: SBBP repeat-containing protein [Dongiaceae bacterium]|nr:SBBP repeat-containing protein [Dongiaceae bacterium]